MSYVAKRGSLSHNNNNKSPTTSSPTAPSPTNSTIPPPPTSRALEAVVEQHFGAIQTIFREFERDSHDTSLIDRVTHPEPRRVELLQDDRLHGERVWVREHLLQWSEKVLSEHRSNNGGSAFVSSSSPTSAGGEGVSDAFAFGGAGGDVTVSVGGGVSGALHDGSFRAFASENVEDLLEVDSSSAFGVDYRKAVRRLGEIGSRLAAAAAVKMKRAEAAAATGGESSGGNPALTELRRRTVAAYQLQQQQQSHHHQGQGGRTVSSFSPPRPLQQQQQQQQQQKYNVPFTAAAAATAAGGRGLSPVSSVAAAGAGGGDSNPQPYTWTNEQLLSVLEHPLIARLQAELARQDALLAVAMEENALLQQQHAVLEEKLRVAVVSTRPMTRSRATETTAVAKGVDVALQCQLVSRLSTPFTGGGVVESTHGTDSVSGSLSGSPRTSMMSGSSSLQTRLYFQKFQNAALLAVVRKLRGELQQQQPGSPSRAGSPSPLSKKKGLLTKGTQVRGDCTLRAANATGNVTLLLSEVDALHRTFIEELFEGLERTGGGSSGGGGLLDGDGVWSDILQAFDNVLSRNPPHADALLSLRARAALALSDFGGGAPSGRGGGGRQSSIASTSSASLGGDLGDLVTDGTSSIGGWSRASSRNAAASKGATGGRLQSSSSPTPSKRKQQPQPHASGSGTNRRANPKPDTTKSVTPPPPLLTTPLRGAAFTSLHATPSLESPSAAVSSPSRRIPAVKFQLQETGPTSSSVVDHHREHVACQTDESWLDSSSGVQHTQSNAEFLSAVSVRGPETLSSTHTEMGVGLSASSRSADVDASLMMTMRSGSLLNMSLNGSGSGSGTATTARYRRPQSARDRIQQGYPLRASISIVTPATTTTANTSADPHSPSPLASVDALTSAVAVVPQRPPQKPSTLPSGRPSSAVSTPSAPLCPRYHPDAQPAEPQNFFPFEHSAAPKFAPPAPVIPPSTPWAPTVIHPVDAERLDGLAQRTQRSAHRVEDLTTRRETWERTQTEQALAAPLTTLSSHHVPVLPVTSPRHPPVAVTPYDAVRPPLTTANSENGSAASSLLFPAHRPAGGGGQVEYNVRGIPPKKPCLVSEEHLKTSPTFLPAYSSSSTSTYHPQRMGVGSEEEQQQQQEEDPRQGLQIAGLAIALDGGGKSTAEGEEDPGLRRPPSAPNATRAQTGPPPAKRMVVNSRKQPFHVPDI